MLVLNCERQEDFSAVTELLCSAAGIELYLPRSTPLGDLAQKVQDGDFMRRRDEARLRLHGPQDQQTAETVALGMSRQALPDTFLNPSPDPSVDTPQDEDQEQMSSQKASPEIRLRQSA